jgi:hypothetical protein
MAKVPDLRNFSPMESQAKNVEDTKMLDTTARETVDQNESNDVGKELVNNEKVTGPFGFTGRN